MTGAVRQAADRNSTGAPIDLTPASTYSVAENDYMALGGDGYPYAYDRGTTQNILDPVLADYIAATTPVSPAIQGRIVCTDSNGADTAIEMIRSSR